VKTAWGEHARSCACGGEGCVTAYSSMFGILLHAGELVGLPFPPLTSLASMFERFLDRVVAGDSNAMAQLELAAEHLGIAIANHLNATDPGNVLVLASSSRFQELVRERLESTVRRNTLPGIIDSTGIIWARSHEDRILKGAAALALEQTYLGHGQPSS
jgi:predicted NBD/HSP70 family sugar kinase